MLWWSAGGLVCEGEIDWFLERVSHEPNYRNWQNLSLACLRYLIHTPHATQLTSKQNIFNRIS